MEAKLEAVARLNERYGTTAVYHVEGGARTSAAACGPKDLYVSSLTRDRAFFAKLLADVGF